MIASMRELVVDLVRNSWILIPPFIIMLVFVMWLDINVGYNIGVILGIFLMVFMPIGFVTTLFIRTQNRRTRLIITSGVLVLVGLFIASITFDPTESSLTETAQALVLNLGTEAIGAALFLVLFRLKKLGITLGLSIGVVMLLYVESQEGVQLDFFINITGEIFGALLTGWIIYEMLGMRRLKNDDLFYDA